MSWVIALNIFRPLPASVLSAAAMIALVAAACGSDHASETPAVAPASGTTYLPAPTLSSTPLPGQRESDRNGGSFAASERLENHDHYFKVPTNIQGAVNRAHAVIIGEVVSLDGTRPTGSTYVGPEGNKVRIDSTFANPGDLNLYSVRVNEVIVDDGFVGDVVRLTGFSPDEVIYNPTVGARYVLVLFRQPDNLEYGFRPFWGMYDISGDTVIREDGTPPEIEAPLGTDEFLAELRRAAADRQVLTFSEWNEPYSDLSASELQVIQ